MSELARKRHRANLEPSRAYVRRRDAMVSAAAEVFRAKGLSDASLNEIGAAIGVDRASIYYYFGSKEHLFRAVILESVQKVVERATEICNGPGSARDRLAAVIKHIVFSFGDDYPALHVYVQEDMRRLGHGADAQAGEEARRLADFADLYMLTLEALISEGIDNGEFRDLGSPDLVARILQEAVNGIHRWFTPDSGIAVDELGELFVELLVGGLATPPPVSP